MRDIILFHNSSEAIWASRVFRKQSIDYKMISVPRHLGSDCGYCISVPDSNTGPALESMKNTGIPFDRVEKNVAL
ncbi:MAG: DUF3343 domain-containing protein [Spirochaetes bacterium]|jgi:hypothetical protein|nr:DUF3343 domain-containing protein [Spirochaetota bacterium]